MAQSLLAHLYSRIRGSQEDVATLSLQYILSQSDVLNKTFTKQIGDILHVELPDLQYTCQATGENSERPDLAGTDLAGNEQVLCEMKFYAGLTGNQPLGYLDRLNENGGKGLLFVCPGTRVTNLWGKLQEVCRERTVEPIVNHCIKVDGVSLAITTWSDILDRLTQVAASSAPDSMSDINQLAGFCAQMDSDAFIPFTTEDLTAGMSRKIDRYYQVVSQTMELLKSDPKLKTSSQRLRSSNVQDGYTRSLYVDGFGVSLSYDRDFWKRNSSAETPFWLLICDTIISTSVWELSPKAEKCLLKIPDAKKEGQWLALEALTDATLEEVCLDLKRQILEYLDVFR